MSEKLIFTNSKGQSITFGGAAPYLLKKLEGTGAMDTDVQMHKTTFQDGQTWINTVLEPRTIAITISIMTRTQEELFQRRRELSRVLNPKLGPGMLLYEYYGGTKEIEVVVEQPPVYPAGKDVKGYGYQEAMISFVCPSPFWRDISSVKEEIAAWGGLLEFPLEITPEGIEMGYREMSLIANIFNPGDVPCGMRIRFKARATVKNPSLFNVNTREELKINKTLDAGEVLTVTTHFANKRVEAEKQGVTESAFQWLDLDSTFLQLEPGDNLLRYNADEGIDNLEVDIYFTPLYVGV